MFDQMMLYALMLITFAHFMCEQKSLQDYTFIPLPNWHKLMNVFLLIEQCSLVLFLGNLSGTLTHDVEATLFGVNLILILILQEKDSIKGEIKWSVLPLLINNSYMIYTNFKSYFWREDSQMASNPSSPSSYPVMHQNAIKVNKQKVFWAIVWYGGSILGYGLMQVNGQGLTNISSKDMLIFSASETLFMVSMALCYFYSWQTYSIDTQFDHQASRSVQNKDMIQAVHLPEVLHSLIGNSSNCLSFLGRTSLCQAVGGLLYPI